MSTALYEEMRLDAQDDVEYIGTDEGVSQRDIDSIFNSGEGMEEDEKK